MGNAEGRGEDGDELNDEFFESPLKINVHSSGKGDQYTKSSSKDDIVKVNVPINSTLSDVGLRMFNIAVLESPARRAKVKSNRRKNSNADIAAAMGGCVCKEDLLNVFMKYRSRLQDLKLEPALDVTKHQIRKDLTREIVEINGSKFSDHTKDSGELDMLEGVLKRSLILQLIKAQERASSLADVTPPSTPPQPPSKNLSSEKNRHAKRLSTNFMDVMDDKLDQILKALSRTNSGADSYNKVVELFGLGGQFLVKPAALRNRPTKILFSEEAQKCIVECYNNYEVVFLDENFSPLTGKKNIVMVETRLIEVIDLGLDVVDDSSFTSKRRSRRVLSITIPTVELELQEQQLDAEVRRKESREDIHVVKKDEASVRNDDDDNDNNDDDNDDSRARSNSMRRRRLRNRVAWSRGRELGRGSAGATLQQRRMAELRFKIAQKKKKKPQVEDLVVD